MTLDKAIQNWNSGHAVLSDTLDVLRQAAYIESAPSGWIVTDLGLAAGLRPELPPRRGLCLDLPPNWNWHGGET